MFARLHHRDIFRPFRDIRSPRRDVKAMHRPKLTFSLMDLTLRKTCVHKNREDSVEKNIKRDIYNLNLLSRKLLRKIMHGCVCGLTNQKKMYT